MTQENVFFVTGIGTGVGKTIVSAILVEALKADYWKPIQAGRDPDTDAATVKKLISNKNSVIHPSVYELETPASPHQAARIEKVDIALEKIVAQVPQISRTLIVEGAGGIQVPINEDIFITDLIAVLQAKVILVSRNYLGSLNHSLLTADFCKNRQISVAGWVFVGYNSTYENDLVRWTGYPKLASVPDVDDPGNLFVKALADSLSESIKETLC